LDKKEREKGLLMTHTLSPEMWPIRLYKKFAKRSAAKHRRKSVPPWFLHRKRATAKDSPSDACEIITGKKSINDKCF
jgi:hypothetical protein